MQKVFQLRLLKNWAVLFLEILLGSVTLRRGHDEVLSEPEKKF